jgi:hypothetical protein
LAVLPDFGFLIADHDSRVRRVWPDGTITTVVGTGTRGFSGDGGPAAAAQLSSPEGLAVLPDGGFLIADTYNSRVRRVWPDGTITTVAGTGTRGFSGDGGPAAAAQLSSPESLAVLPDGGFLIADTYNSRVRRVWLDGTISTTAGTGTEGFAGDGGQATAAQLSFPRDLAVLPDGGFLIADQDNSRVRRVWPDGTITTVAGDGNQLYASSDDGGPATAASMSPLDLAVLPDGGLLIDDDGSVRLVVGPGGTDVLAAAIRARLGTAWARGYSVRTALTKPAQLTVRLYRSPKAPPSLTTRASAPAGEWTLVAKRRRALTAGIYAVDLRADANGQATRTVQYVYLGGLLTKKIAMRLPADPRGARIATGRKPAHTADEDPTDFTTRCRRFGQARIDCVIVSTYDTPRPGECSWVSSYQLARNGQIALRTYGCPPRRKTKPFERHPHWRTKPESCNLFFLWK